ncbi:MAG: hypothetical protein ACI9H8_000747 [Lysobacterales bacterium]|jgi:hypothetical protein
MPKINHIKIFLHLSLLSGLAFAQPLYNLVGATPEFLFAHRLEPIHLIAYVAVLSLGLPVLIFLVYRMAHFVSKGLGGLILRVFITVLFTLVILPLFSYLPVLNGVLTLGLAFSAAFIFAGLYFKKEGFRLFLTWFSPATLVFAVNFICFTPVSAILEFGDDAPGHKNLSLQNTPPVIMVVFDEFPLVSLLNDQLEIDEGRFPNISALAESAAWYRYHTTNSDSTLVSIPNLLSGNLPFERDSGLPSHRFFSNNLMALLQNQYQVTAIEHGTRLCPESACDQQPAYFKLLFTDSAVILGQIWLPPDLALYLPATNNDWLGFMGEEITREQDGPANIREFQKTINWRTRVVQYQQFVEGISRSSARLYYVHSMFPHAAWLHLPDGRLLTADPSRTITGISPNGPESVYKHVWYQSDALARISRQRHVLQVGFVDMMVGQLVGRLKELGIYDESLLVITSDHGVSFNAGFSRRSIHGDNLAEIAGVPLFIKYPGNYPSGVSDLNSQSMDIIPTVLDAMGVVGWKQFDGQSLLDTNRNEDLEKVIYSEKRHTDNIGFSEYRIKLQTAVQRLTQEYGQSDWTSLYAAGDHQGLVGRSLNSINVLDAHAPVVTYEYPDFLKNSRMDDSLIQSVVHGSFDGSYDDNPSPNLAISVNGVIRSVTETFSIPGYDNSFQAIIPTEAFGEGNADIRTLFVMETDSGVALLEANSIVGQSYRLVADEDSGWSIMVDDQTISVERGEVTGWVTAISGQTPNSFDTGGWAADLEAKLPADRILVFTDGEFYYSMKPDRDSERTATQFQMRGILRSGFRFPVSLNHGKTPLNLEVRVFALSTTGKISEMNYPKDPQKWPFKTNPPANGTGNQTLSQIATGPDKALEPELGSGSDD